jgi:ABC-2 type transport system ATP-binding protein
MTVIDQLLFLAEIHGLKRREALPAIRTWLERVELADWGRRKVEELSKGMQQKIQLIGTVLHQPDILILDEPFSGLDPINQGLFKELLADYRQQGRTILFSTHGMEQAEKLCDHIGLISHGRVVLAGELREIKQRLGGNSYRLVAEGDLTRLDHLPEILQVVRRPESGQSGESGLRGEHAVGGGAVKLLLRPGASGPEVLRQIAPFLAVREFRSEEPDLEEIFIKAVHDAA